MSVAGTRTMLIGALLLVLGAVNWSIYGKERIRTQGEVILLELAPVDPRSLMQGDYMALRFRLADQIQADSGGTAALALDERGVATYQPDAAPGAPRIRYRMHNGRVWLGTNAYFFEEGTAQRYEPARYGEFRLDRRSGEAVLTGLRDADLQPL